MNLEIFAQNLRKLSATDASVTLAAERCGINRTQFNRYRAGVSMPLPDALLRICKAYNTDERILTRPLADLQAEAMLLSDLRAVADSSEGVAGWHQNGDLADWDELGLSVDRIDAIKASRAAQT